MVKVAAVVPECQRSVKGTGLLTQKWDTAVGAGCQENRPPVTPQTAAGRMIFAKLKCERRGEAGQDFLGFEVNIIG